MGYRCPACDVPQADGEHLANHLALTALTRGGEHVEWLDEHAPGWGDDSPPELAERVVEHAPETDDEPSTHAHRDPDLPDSAVGRAEKGRSTQFDGVVDAAVEDVLDEARSLTEEMFEDADDDPASEPDEGSASEPQEE